MADSETKGLLKLFRNYVADNGKFLSDYIANQEVNFPPDIRGGEGGQAKDAKLPMDWPKKLKPISGGDFGSHDRKEHGTGDWQRSTKEAKTGDPYLHKHMAADEHGDNAYTEGQATAPYDSKGPAEHEGYDIEKMPPMDADEDMEEEEEIKEPEENEEVPEDEMKALMGEIKSLTKQNMRLQKYLLRKEANQRAATLQKQQAAHFEMAVTQHVESVLKKMGISSTPTSTPDQPVPAMVIKSEPIKVEPAIVQKATVTTPGIPDAASFDSGQMASFFGRPVDNVGDFTQQVKNLAGSSEVNGDLKGEFDRINKMRSAAQNREYGVIPYVPTEEYSKLKMRFTKQTKLGREGAL